MLPPPPSQVSTLIWKAKWDFKFTAIGRISCSHLWRKPELSTCSSIFNRRPKELVGIVKLLQMLRAVESDLTSSKCKSGHEIKFYYSLEYVFYGNTELLHNFSVLLCFVRHKVIGNCIVGVWHVGGMMFLKLEIYCYGIFSKMQPV